VRRFYDGVTRPDDNVRLRARQGAAKISLDRPRRHPGTPAAMRQPAAAHIDQERTMTVEPDAGHRIDIIVNRHRVRVIHGGITIADTLAALTVCETGYPDVFYFPRADVNMARLDRSERTAPCPHKGQAAYFHLRTEDGRIEDAAWSYESPHETVRVIGGYLAFDAARVDRIDQTS
jgi:uncharacterized protein (DUF427 family)